MILYMDTSSLVKLYVDEVHSEAVHRWVQMVDVIATSRVAYPETLAALARRRREGDFDEASFQRVTTAFRAQWLNFALVNLNETLAGELAITHVLRGFDAIHLAAALDLRRQAEGVVVTFAAFDVRLMQAAKTEGFQLNDSTGINPQAG